MEFDVHFQAAVGTLKVDHFGIAVYDIDQAIAHYRHLLGVTPWRKGPFESDALWRGEAQRIGGIVAKAAMGPIQIELVQPTLGEWTPSVFLERHGEGIYHAGYYVENLETLLERLSTLGSGPELLGRDEHGPLFTYTAPEDLCGMTLEFIGPRIPLGWKEQRVLVY